MGARAEPLKAQIERTKEDLNRDLTQLREQVGILQRRAAMVLGGVVLLVIAVKVTRSLLNRARD